jgi:NADH:ubiquinone oxidoreductase subunit 2 (subunit N)
VGIYYYVGIIRAALVDSATATSTLAKPRKSTQLAFILCLIGIFMMVGTQSVMDFIQGNADQVIQVTQK